MSFPKYPKYRESGVEWLGELPHGWSALRIRSLFQIKKRIVGEVGPDVLSITQQGIKIKDTESNEGQLSMDYSKYQIVEPGDFAMNHMDLLTGFVDISPVFGVTSPDYRVFANKDGVGVFPRFFLYVFQNAYRQKIFYADGQGSSQLGRWRLPTDAFLNFGLPVPPVAEQREIAMFLDQEMAKIDALIEEQRRLIELLKEKRQAVTAHAVSKGLNPATSAADSGLPWIGSIPAHWTVKELGDLAQPGTSITYGIVQAGPNVDHGVPYIRTSDMSGDHLRRGEYLKTSPEIAAQFERSKVRSGDLVIAIRATVGKALLVPDFLDGANLTQGTAKFSPGQDCDAEFVRYFLNTVASAEFDLYAKGSTFKEITLDRLRRIRMCLPPLEEQKSIVRKLNAITSELLSLIGVVSESIALLQERRSTLISSAVTGKIDVRQPARKPVASVKAYTSGFAHQLLAAKILSCCNDSHMGRVKLQKLIHVAEYHAQIGELQGNYTRKMAGPLDMTAMKGLEAGLERLRWFKTIQQTEPRRYRYIPLSKYEHHRKYLERWADKETRIEEVLTLMGGMTMRQCEIVSTLYAAWNDLLIDGHPATEDSILAQATTAEGWHASKEKTPRESWIKALRWMNEKGLVPTGFGTHTKKARAEDVHEPA